MTDKPGRLHILLVEDDAENLQMLCETLPPRIGTIDIDWEPCDSFEEARKLVQKQRYDLIVTDVYRDREDKHKSDVDDERAHDLIEEVRSRTFCPVIAFTDGSAPQSFSEGPFVTIADKSRGNDDIIEKIEVILGTGIPQIARKLHDELDSVSSYYLWEFLEERWSDLEAGGITQPDVLERIVRRRAATQLSRLVTAEGALQEVAEVEGLEFYLYPPISKTLKLGSLLKHRNLDLFQVVMTPHCYLEVQPGHTAPRVDLIMTVRATPAEALLTEEPLPSRVNKIAGAIRKRIGSPAEVGQPRGRFWFLPSLLDIPDLYCDFCQVDTLPRELVATAFEPVAVIDAPYAEALQTCFARFYSSVGLPVFADAYIERLRSRYWPDAQ